jgi:hypothetical protein
MTYLNPNTVLKPTANVAYGDAEFLQEMVGNREDKSFSNGTNHPSVLGALKANYYHVHDKAKVYPTLADSINIVSDAAAWTLGAITEVVPANAITKWFDIHWIIVHQISGNDEYELVVYKGAALAEEEIGRIAFGRISNFDASNNFPIQIPPQAANTRISMALASKGTVARNIDVKIYYHTYPDIT